METVITIIALAIFFIAKHWWDAFHLIISIPVIIGTLILIWQLQKSLFSRSPFDYQPDPELMVKLKSVGQDESHWPQRLVLGAAKAGITLLVVWLAILVANATPLPGLFYDRGFDKLVANDIPLLQSAKAYDRVTEIGLQRLERPLSTKKQTALAQYVYQAMIDWGDSIADQKGKQEKFTQAKEFAQKWNIDFQLAQAKLENTKLQESILGPADLPINVKGTITQIDTSTFPPVIIAYVAVEYANGEPIDWLKPKDFLVSNNGTPISQFDIAPISSQDQSAIVLAMDVSGSTKGQPIASSQAGAQDFIMMLGDNDLIKIIKFNQSVTVLSWEKDKKKLGQEINKLRAKGNTAIYDAIDKGIDALMEKTKQSQKAIVLFTDGADTHSKQSLEAVLKKANSVKIPIYVIGLKSDDLSPEVLNRIANETQGDYQEADNPDKLSKCYQKIGNKIKKQYRVVITVSEPSLPVQNSLTISIGRKNGINLAKTYER